MRFSAWDCVRLSATNQCTTYGTSGVDRWEESLLTHPIRSSAVLRRKPAMPNQKIAALFCYQGRQNQAGREEQQSEKIGNLLQGQHDLLIARHVNQFVPALFLLWDGKVKITGNGVPGADFRQAFFPEFGFNGAAVALSGRGRGLLFAADRNTHAHALALVNSAAVCLSVAIIIAVIDRAFPFIANFRSAVHARAVFPVG